MNRLHFTRPEAKGLENIEAQGLPWVCCFIAARPEAEGAPDWERFSAGVENRSLGVAFCRPFSFRAGPGLKN